MPASHVPLLPLPAACCFALLKRRTKRFIIECLLLEEAPGERKGTRESLAHTNNSGSMLGLLRPGSLLLLSAAPSEKRKLPYTLEYIRIDPRAVKASPSDSFPPLPVGPARALALPPGLWAGVNTLTPNRLLRAAFEAGLLPWAKGYTGFQPEARRGQSRLDALLTGPGLPPFWVECKNVTLVEDETAAFPDAVTERGQKHLRELADIARSGERAALFFCVQREDARCFAPAGYIDPDYAALFRQALAQGVEAHPHLLTLSLRGVDLGPELPLAPGG
ncbi:DNA/RNA nuclease SfsA [Desulfovibrio sp. OttesenSCG-928-A18]|nr:DNA/RNA nuclease SfsA [Desulfovibrio sp. OttesenSCG-928-A18]